ncbi:hypothetical protein N0V93_006588 [Gnomoniopsis smithogilvyi]|uniref:Tyrosine specific protein phosphatases domain-containing protein n=1 Tax=Gnomoniopsis smithogilvyi TaxID=1191159 RepID=A0A9W8YR15_9PEZI|nr:hypothetical protein N0V93_006588 [Gnomoniopsis smithogilvyi]
MATVQGDTAEQSEGVVSKSLGQESTRKTEVWNPNQAQLGQSLVLDDSFVNAFPGFASYADLDALRENAQQNLRAIATKIMETQLRWMDEERVEATWITPNILLDGILGSIDPKTLQTLCEADGFKHVVMVSLHPDDWVAGGVWKAHGRLKWTKRQSSVQEQDHGLAARLVDPLWDQPERLPQIIIQNGDEYRSPVIDHLVIPLEDGDGSSLLMQLPDICRFVSQHNRPDVLIVIHCKVGLSRSNAAQEAFVLQAVYQELRKDAQWMDKDFTQKQADLQRVCQIYHKLVQQRRLALKSKFPNQMANWAKYLADDEPQCGPDFATDQSSPGGNDMRDAAITACYELGVLLPLKLIPHYHKRTEAGTETAQKTIRRFQNAEQERRDRTNGDGVQDTPSWLPIAEFVNVCKAIHESKGPDRSS